MNLKFIKIQLHNFASYGDESLDLADMGFTLVTGRNNCKLDNAYSNGSGKSAIFNGLVFALTGETSQGISSGLENIFGDPEDCWVKLNFMYDGDEFIVQRFKTPKQNLKVFINGEDKSGKGVRESTQLLSTYIPDLTPELLSSIIILGQGLPNKFTNNKPSHRKELLESLTKSDFMIQSIKDSLECRQSDLRLLLRKNEDHLVANNSQLEVYNNQLAKLNLDLDKYNQCENIDQEILYTSDKLDSIEKDIVNNNRNILRLETELSSFRDKKTTIICDRDGKVKESTSIIELNLQSNTKELYELSAEIKSLSNEIKKLESIIDICPTCGQKIPEVNKPDTSEQNKELHRLIEKSNEIELRIKELQEEKIAKINTLAEEYKSNIEYVDSNISRLNSELKQSREDLADNNNLKSKTALRVSELKNLKENFNKLIYSIDETNENIKNTEDTISRVTAEISNINAHLEVVQQLITLAKREFRGILLSNVIEFIDKKVKKYSMEVFGTDKLSFTLNDNYIDITYCDKLYENLSGGEKQKIDIIIQLALRDILSKQLNIHSNLLVLDEIYDNADSISCQKITNLISTLTDIDSIFIISHHVNDLGLTWDNNLLVEKDDSGISHLSFI